MMETVATMKDGNYFYIKDLSIIDEAFIVSLSGLMSVVG